MDCVEVARLRLPEVDTDLVKALARHWTVTIEGVDGTVVYVVYKCLEKEDGYVEGNN